jgi:putative NADH-flavin reductase
MRIAVFGANGHTGRLLTAQALAEGHDVTAVTRRPEGFPIRQDRLRVLGGDVLEPGTAARAVAGQDAVLSTLGVPFSRDPIDLFSRGTAAIVEAMREHGPRRLVVVSSSATEPDPVARGGPLFRRVLQPLFTGVVGRTLYDDLRRMEALVGASGLDWTILRPSGLFETAGVTAYRTGDGHPPADIDGRFTSRADLADAMLRQLDDDRGAGRIVAVSTVDVRPGLLQLLLREGIMKQRRVRPVAPAG